DLVVTIHVASTVAAECNVASCIEHDVLDFLDIFESVSFALEGDVNLEGSLCTGVHTSWSENFDFSNAWLFEDIEVTCWQPVILETLQVNHSLGWICLLEIEWTVANPEVTFCFVPCL